MNFLFNLYDKSYASRSNAGLMMFCLGCALVSALAVLYLFANESPAVLDVRGIVNSGRQSVLQADSGCRIKANAIEIGRQYQQGEELAVLSCNGQSAVTRYQAPFAGVLVASALQNHQTGTVADGALVAHMISPATRRFDIDLSGSTAGSIKAGMPLVVAARNGEHVRLVIASVNLIQGQDGLHYVASAHIPQNLDAVGVGEQLNARVIGKTENLFSLIAG